MNHNQENDKIEYLKTVLITLLCLIVVISLVVFDTSQSTHDRISASLITQLDLKKEQAALDDLYKQEKITPGDFMVNLKIAMIHELFKEDKKALENYEKAYLKAPKNTFVIYRFALFLISQKQYEKALTLIEIISDRPDKKIMNMKTTFYTKISESLAENKDYLAALNAAKLASKYARMLSGSKQALANKNLADKYIQAADYYVEQKEDEEAAVMLKSSLKTKESNIAKYKLALIYEENYPQMAYRLMEEVFNSSETQIVNLQVYYDVIKRLYDDAMDNSDGAAANFYAHKEDRLKKYITKNYLFGDELKLSEPVISKRKPGLWKNDQNYIAFSITNISKNDIGPLFIKVDFEAPRMELRTFEKKIASAQATLAAGKNPKELLFNLNDGGFYKPNPSKANSSLGKISIYGKKNSKLEWVLLYEGTIDLQKIQSSKNVLTKLKA